jgi:hypothetical protein
MHTGLCHKIFFIICITVIIYCTNYICCLVYREYGYRDPSRWPRDILYPQKLSITSPTSGGRLVGIVRSRTQAMEFLLNLLHIRHNHIDVLSLINAFSGAKCWASLLETLDIPVSTRNIHNCTTFSCFSSHCPSVRHVSAANSKVK